MTDVNAAFDASKLDQINAAANRLAVLAEKVANGELRDNGNGTFTVLTGWDRNETIRYTEGKFVAEHGLDTMADGRAKFYSTQREWFGLGQIVPDGLDDIHKVLELIGGALEFSKRPAFYQDPKTGEFREIPNTFAATWTDLDMNSGAMGTVGKVYKHAQDDEAASFLLDLIGDKVVWESVGRMNNNAKFFAGLRLREDMVIDPSGIADGIRQYLYLINSHDGTGKLNFIVTPWRIRCRNTERFAVADAVSSWGVRHTGSWDSDSRKREARTALGLTANYYQQWQAEQMELLGLKLTGTMIDKFWSVVDNIDGENGWARPEDKGRGLTMYQNRRDSLEELLATNMRDLGRNAYAAERAVTEFLDHKVSRRKDEARLGAALLGNDDDKKANLHYGLLSLARG